MRLPLLVVALCVLGTNGCVATYARTEIGAVSGSNELPSTVTGRHISLTVGAVVTAHIGPFNTDGNPMVGDVASEDNSVLEVSRAYGEKNYAFLGRRAGKTHVELKADGVVVALIDAEVLEQVPQ